MKVVKGTMLLKGSQTRCKSNLIYHQGVKLGRKERERENKKLPVLFGIGMTTVF